MSDALRKKQSCGSFEILTLDTSHGRLRLPPLQALRL
jgi:hypothetical protein